MKKKVIIGILLIIILFSFIYGNWKTLTGNTVQEISCVDSDERLGYYTKGSVIGKSGLLEEEKEYADYCYNRTDSNITGCGKGFGCSVKEYYCGFKNLVQESSSLCRYGCNDGACLKEDSKKKIETENKTIETKENQTQEEPELVFSERQKISLFEKIVGFFKNLFKNPNQ
ncbi:MAG: hypothetical protein ABIG37_03620 [Nanoarchaeota archaeon]|nr:hypothetical protein [Nanoarchaeota archaeon]